MWSKHLVAATEVEGGAKMFLLVHVYVFCFSLPLIYYVIYH